MLLSFAQKETFDLFAYTPPSGWAKEATDNSISYIVSDQSNGSWCRISVIRSTVSKGSIDADFESEWQDLIVKNYNPTEEPILNEVFETDGWKVKEGVAKFTFNNTVAQAMLTTISGFDRCASIVIILNSQEYLKEMDTFLKSVEFKTMETITRQPESGNISDTASIFGTWSATASDQSSFRVNNGAMNYITRQYTFNPDGTFSFISKAFDPLMDKILLGRENGTYQLHGNNISITPAKSVLEAWSKYDGKDEWGKFLSSQNIVPENVTYQFSMNYFSGIKEWSLVLHAGNQTQRDGPFSSTSTNNAWIYSPISTNKAVIKLPGEK
jgi:hypothetical protein